SGDPKLSELIWNCWQLMIRTYPDEMKNLVVNDLGHFSGVNVSAIVPELVRRGAAADGHGPYLCYNRLRERARPAHMAAWDNVPLDTFGPTRGHAIAPTGMTGRFSTIQLDQKKAAWDVLLCRGDRSLLPPFADALAGEKSPYVLHTFLEL